MKKERRKFTSAFKAKVAVEAIKEDLTIMDPFSCTTYSKVKVYL